MTLLMAICWLILAGYMNSTAIVDTSTLLTKNAQGYKWNLTFLKENPKNLFFFPEDHNSTALHVAHCITGQLRTLYFPSVYLNYKSWVVDPLKVPSKLFFVVTNETTDKYKPAFDHLKPTEILYTPVDSFSNGTFSSDAPDVKYKHREQFLKRAVCYELVLRFERRAAGLIRFSHIITTRPDVLLKPFGPASTWPRDQVVIPRRIGSGGSGVIDIMAVVPRGVANRIFIRVVKGDFERYMNRSLHVGDQCWNFFLRQSDVARNYSRIDYHIIRDRAKLKKIDRQREGMRKSIRSLEEVPPKTIIHLLE